MDNLHFGWCAIADEILAEDGFPPIEPIPAGIANGRYCLGFSDACPSLTVRRARGQASEKPQGRKPRGEFAPSVVSVYGDLERFPTE